MARTVLIKHKDTGLTKKGKIGFSWTYLLFGWFVPLFRGELSVAAFHLLFSIFSFGLWQIICSFLYNKQYMVRMLTNGWELADLQETNEKAMNAIGISSESNSMSHAK